VGFISLYQELISDIDLPKSEVIHPKSVCFLCGGPVNLGAPAPKSMREALLRHLDDHTRFGRAEILLAERAIEKLPETEFENLLDFEECIASIVAAVVLIVESPGSICELGAFIKTTEISKKLVTVVQNEHQNRRSFITLGALKYLSGKYPNRAHIVYHWSNDANGDLDAADHVFDGLKADIPDAIERAHQRERFNEQELGHRIYLVLTCCHLLRVAKLGEIKQCFDLVRISVTETEIRKYLNTLEICGYIKKVINGLKNTYYVSLVERIPLEIAFKEKVRDDNRNSLRRIQLLVAEIIREEPIRLTIFQEHNHAH